MDNLAPLHAQAGRTRFAKSLNNAEAAAYVSLSFRMTNRVTLMSSRRAPFGLAPDGASHGLGRAVALAVLCTVFLFHDKVCRKKGSKPSGLARPTGRRCILAGQIACPKSRTTFWASGSCSAPAQRQHIADVRYGA